MTSKYLCGINFRDIDIFRQHVTLAFYANNDPSAKICPVTINDTQGKTVLHSCVLLSIQHKNGCLADSDLFVCLHNQLSSIHLLHVLQSTEVVI